MDVELKDVAGYLTEKAVWQIIKDGASEQNPDIWQIGATAFYALMGVEIFGGRGREVQNANTPVPRIGVAHCSRQLSDTVFRCLSYKAEERLSQQELLASAEIALAANIEPQKRLATSTGKNYKTSIVKFWPEEMCPVVVLLITLLLSLGASAQAKPPLTSEMEVLVKHCCDLRNPRNVERVERALYNDRQWTLMDEIAVDSNGECTIRDKVKTLGLNEMGYRIARYNRGVSNTGGRFRNGKDSRYNYSFIEVTAKRGATLRYEIDGREGRQVFAVVPYRQGAVFEVSLTKEGSPLGRVYDNDGVKYIVVDEDIVTRDTLCMQIKNLSGTNLAFVIINYNSHKLEK